MGETLWPEDSDVWRSSRSDSRDDHRCFQLLVMAECCSIQYGYQFAIVSSYNSSGILAGSYSSDRTRWTFSFVRSHDNKLAHGLAGYHRRSLFVWVPNIWALKRSEVSLKYLSIFCFSVQCPCLHEGILSRNEILYNLRWSQTSFCPIPHVPHLWNSALFFHRHIWTHISTFSSVNISICISCKLCSDMPPGWS